MSLKLFAIVTAVTLLTGCGALKDAKEMKSTMKDLKRTGEHISKRTDDLEREMKLNTSTVEFGKFADRVFGENGMGRQSSDSRSTNPETEMLAEAEKAIRALLYQLWKGDYNEGSQESLDKDFELASVMFFTRIKRYVPHSGDLNVALWSGAGWLPEMYIPDRGYKGLASLAARLEQNQESYVKALELRGLPTNLSFYEMIMQALASRNDVKQAGLLPRTKTKILEWKNEAVFTIQMRHNYLPMMVLSRVSDFADRGDLRRGWMAFVSQSRFNLNDPDPSKNISNALLVETTHWLNLALETRARLRAVGIEPKFNHMFGIMLRRVDFDQRQILARKSPSTGNSQRDLLVYNFAMAYDKVVSEMPSNLVGSTPQAPPLIAPEAPVAPPVAAPAAPAPTSADRAKEVWDALRVPVPPGPAAPRRSFWEWLGGGAPASPVNGENPQDTRADAPVAAPNAPEKPATPPEASISQ